MEGLRPLHEPVRGQIEQWGKVTPPAKCTHLCNVEMDNHGREVSQAKSKWHLFHVDHDVLNKSKRKRERN